MIMPPVRPEERTRVAVMFVFFFLIITSFWIMKPLKTALFLRYYKQSGLDLLVWQLTAAQAEQLAKVSNVAVAFIASGLFAYLSHWFRRERLTYLWSVFIILSYLGFMRILADPSPAGIWSFYLFGDLYNSLMVASFFAFLNDSLAPEQAKRLYGPIVLGGIIGGAFGTLVVQRHIREFSISDWLWICLALAVITVVVAWIAGRLFTNHPGRRLENLPVPELVPRHSVMEGARLILKSPYLMSIAAIVLLYENVSALMDFQFKTTASHHLDGPDLDAYLANVYFVTNGIVAVFVQLFISSQLMTRFGVGAALLVLPIGALISSTSFMVAPLLFTGGALNALDKGLSYSINQSAKEVLYVPSGWKEKYQAKAFIDVFLQRTARATAVLLSLPLTLVFSGSDNIRWLSLVTILLLVLWMKVAIFSGRTFRSKTQGVAPIPLRPGVVNKERPRL